MDNEKIDTSLGKNIGGFIKGYAIGYAAVKGIDILKNILNSKRTTELNKHQEQRDLAEYNNLLDDILIKPNTRITGECYDYMTNTTHEQRIRDLADPTSPGYNDHGKYIDDLFYGLDDSIEKRKQSYNDYMEYNMECEKILNCIYNKTKR